MRKNTNYLVKSTIGLILGASFSHTASAIDPSAAMGQGLYEQTGANSCLYCHGQGGHGGKTAGAADLSKPKTWKVYKALGGDAALAKNKSEFLKNMEEASLNLIEKGAIAHNAGFKKPYFDWKKTGGTYNAQMLGLGGAPSVAWLGRFKDKGVTKALAAKAVYLYLNSIDTQSVFK